MGSVWLAGDVITHARMNQKTILVDTGANINLATPYTGMLAYCTTTGSGFTAGLTYQYNGSAWVVFGIASSLQVTDLYDTTIGDYTTPTAVQGSSPSVVFDNPGQSNYTASSVNTLSLANFAIGSGSNRMLVCAISRYNSSTDPSSVTFGAQNLTQLSKQIQGTGALWIYYLVAPTTGSSTSVTANFAGNDNTGLAAISYNNTIQSSSAFGTPIITTAASGTSNTASVTTGAANSMVFSALQINGAPTNVAATSPLRQASVVSQGTIGVADQRAPSTGSYANTWTWTTSSLNTNISVEIKMVAGMPNPLSNLIDGNTGTEWVSDNEVAPYAVVDMGASAFLTACAIYYDNSTTTATQVLIQLSSDLVNWTTVRTINTNLFTNGAWNYFRWNLPSVGIARFLRIIGNDGSAKILALWELKVKQYANSLAGLTSLMLVHGHPLISSSVATTPLNA